MKVLFFGDIIGEPGREALKVLLPELRREFKPDFVIANGENSAHGFGITPKILEDLFSFEIDVITSGNHIWDKKEVMQIIDTEPRLLRPANYPPGVAGIGFKVYTALTGIKIGVLNLEGRVFLSNIDCPFRAAKEAIKTLKEETKIIIVDFHAEITSEKNALAYYLDGEASAIFGTHTHVQTADERILPGGTAFITDAGMCGSANSVIGMKKELALQRFLYDIPVRFEVATDKIKINGVFVEIEDSTGKALSITRISRDCLRG
ncbi:MAG: TIGR00282 family metallophosphoesterase [Candidatus Firestonebacteria bacterium]|nr:TIGR00282 family metallophosphoesterase [Candidatus Firestonebacteria bacterium]